MTMPLLKHNGTNSTIPSNSTYTFTLHARDIYSRDNQGPSTMAIAGIIIGVALGLIACGLIIIWAIKSHRAAFAASGGRRGEVRRANGGGGGRARTPADMEKGFSNPVRQAYGGNPAGMTIPPSQSYGHSRTKVQFPGPKNGFVPPHNTSRPGGGRSSGPACQGGRGPYADDSPYAATATMEPRGSGRQGGREQYSNH